MAAAATADNLVLNIGDMIDLAIGTPEVGVVDFNMLQTVLHCLAQQQHILQKPVEVRGLSLPVARDNTNSSTVNVTEFAVGIDGKPPVPKVETKVANDTILVVERVKKTDNAASQTTGPTAAAVAQAAAPSQAASKAGVGAGAAAGTPAAGTAGAAGQAGAPGASGTDGLTLVTISKFNLLDNAVQELQKRVYGSIPKNEEILEEVRSQTNIKAIQDMWTNLNVSARLEAAEAAIEKLSSLIQDIISESAGLQDVAAKAATLGAPSVGSEKSGAPSSAGGVSDKADMSEIMNYMNQLKGDLDRLTDSFYAAMKQMPVEVALPPRPQTETLTGPAVEEILPPRSDGGVVDRGVIVGGGGSGPRSEKLRATGIDGDVLEVMGRLNDLEKRVEKCCQMLGKGEGVISDQLTSFQDQLEYLAKQVANLSNIAGGSLSPDLIKDLQGLMQLFQTVQEMQEQLKQVHDTALQLAEEKEDRKHHLDVLLEQIELLKTIKLDREDMAEAMAEKADLRMLARKVSHDQFELACDDLSRGLEQALGKLNMQEALWQQALDDIQREIETKLDKLELSPVKEFFNAKLKLLQDSLKQMASLRREAEAAGTKRKLLRDVNCLSCDANAVMAAEAPPSIPVPKPFPAALSMKPYLSYELDSIRKTQASNLPQRNMHDWENIDKQMTHQPKPTKARSGTDKHLCNRYCGGSHTTTTPAQRVARLGHFIKQWGPDVLPLSSGFATGDDGRMYRVQEGSPVGPGGAADSTCTPKPPKKTELPQISTDRIAEDCKCMEAAPSGSAKK